MNKKAIRVVGAGLAGSECAWQLAERGLRVELIEQKPIKRTPAQQTDHFAELVCSNSFRGAALHNAVGLLKEEMRRSGSLIMRCADQHSLPAGGALAVDREAFSAEVTRNLRAHPLIDVRAEEVNTLAYDGTMVIATGPLTSEQLAKRIAQCVGQDHLAYYDAIAPVVSADSIDWDKVFRASRYDKGGDDAYVNCPLDQTQYETFVNEVIKADKVKPREFEEIRYFEGCLPVEVMAERGPQTLAFGPMKPVGLTDPRTGRWAHAVVQLRAEDQAQTAFNMVGFQTRMTFAEQKRVFGLIPGLEQAEFLRFGTVHRNTFVNAPIALNDELALHQQANVHLAGQITGVEGYLESAACGFVVGVGLAHKIQRGVFLAPAANSALGALYGYLRTVRDNFQPSNILWSMFAPLEGAHKRLDKRTRYLRMAERALEANNVWMSQTRGRAGIDALVPSTP